MQGYNAAYLSRCLKLPKLTREEEEKTFLEYQNGSQPALDTLVMHHIKLVDNTTFQFKKWGVPHDDMMPIGIMGLITGINKFDPRKGFRISTYAVWYIKMELQKYVAGNAVSQIRIDTNTENRRMFFSFRYVKSKFGFYERLNYEQAQIIGDHFGVSPEKAYELDLRLEGEWSIDQPIAWEDGAEITLADILMGENGFDIDDQLDRPAKIALIREASSVLNEQEKLVIERIYYDDDDKTQTAISKELNLGIMKIQQIRNEAFVKMRKFLLNNGIKKYSMV